MSKTNNGANLGFENQMWAANAFGKTPGGNTASRR